MYAPCRTCIVFEVLQFCAGGGRGANQTLIPGHGKLSPSNAKLSPSVPPAFSRKIFFKVPTTVACYQTDGRGALQFCLLLKSTRLPSFSAWYVHSGCPAASWPVPAILARACQCMPVHGSAWHHWELIALHYARQPCQAPSSWPADRQKIQNP